MGITVAALHWWGKSPVVQMLFRMVLVIWPVILTRIMTHYFKVNTWGLVTPCSGIDMDQHWHRLWLAACRKFLSMASPWSSTHCGLVALRGDIDLGQHWLRYLACCLTAQSHYLNQRWLIIGKVQYGIHLRYLCPIMALRSYSVLGILLYSITIIRQDYSRALNSYKCLQSILWRCG